MKILTPKKVRKGQYMDVMVTQTQAQGKHFTKIYIGCMSVCPVTGKISSM